MLRRFCVCFGDYMCICAFVCTFVRLCVRVLAILGMFRRFCVCFGDMCVFVRLCVYFAIVCVHVLAIKCMLGRFCVCFGDCVCFCACICVNVYIHVTRTIIVLSHRERNVLGGVIYIFRCVTPRLAAPSPRSFESSNN